MSNFMEQLQKNSKENTLELREERERKAILNQMFSNIKKKCEEASKHGYTSVRISIHSELYGILDENNEHLFFKGPGPGYKYDLSDEEMRKRQAVFCRPEEIRTFLELKLAKEGFVNFELNPLKRPLYEVIEKVTENSMGMKVLSGALNLFYDSNIEVETTTRKVRKQVGEQISDFKLSISWDY